MTAEVKERESSSFEVSTNFLMVRRRMCELKQPAQHRSDIYGYINHSMVKVTAVSESCFEMFTSQPTTFNVLSGHTVITEYTPQEN